MDKKSIINALEKLRKESKKRNFNQSVDLIITLQDIDLKNSEQQVDFFINLHYNTGKKKTVCALVGPELSDEAKKVCEETIPQNQFDQYKDKKKTKKLAKKYDYFIAQGNLMSSVASIFGRTLGPVGKMPNPKAGGIIAAKQQIKPLYEKLQKTVHVVAKKEPVIHVMVGKEDMNKEEIVDNVQVIYNQLIHHLLKEKNNIRKVYLKLTMSKPVKI